MNRRDFPLCSVLCAIITLWYLVRRDFLDTLSIVLCTVIPTYEEKQSNQCDFCLLSETEKQRAARFKFQRDRWSYTAAHSMLRKMLAEYYGHPPHTWHFRTNNRGRPEIEPSQKLSILPRFSISHTDGMAACALTIGTFPTQGIDIGVDVECLSRTVDAIPLARRFFSTQEMEWLNTLPDEQIGGEFLRVWTLKESVAKALGLGLALDFRSFYCSVQPLSVQFQEHHSCTSHIWELYNWFVAPQHCMSLAVQSPHKIQITVTVRHLSSLTDLSLMPLL